MKNAIVAAAVAGFAIAMQLTPALACDNGSGRGVSHAENAAAGAPSGTPHYQRQYSYDRHAQWMGHWVLVK